MDVVAWLQNLRLERYVSAFRDNDVDAEVLLKLTADDLINIRMTSVGHRRMLLDAIADLGREVPTDLVASRASGGTAQVDAERRQLTAGIAWARRRGIESAFRRSHRAPARTARPSFDSRRAEGFDTADMKEAKALLDQLA
jgi:SAM domain (Sterile alpha motif)